MLNRIKVYVAGPYSKPDPCVNTHDAIRVGSLLWDRGYTPFVPHLTHLWHTVAPRPYIDWLAYDLVWLAACDVLLRLPGESSGADLEIEFAKERGIHVVHSFHELDVWAGKVDSAKDAALCARLEQLSEHNRATLA